MTCYFFDRLILDMKPDQGQKSHQGQSGDQPTDAVTTLGKLGYRDHNGRGDKIFYDEPSHFLERWTRMFVQDQAADPD